MKRIRSALIIPNSDIRLRDSHIVHLKREVADGVAREVFLQDIFRTETPLPSKTSHLDDAVRIYAEVYTMHTSELKAFVDIINEMEHKFPEASMYTQFMLKLLTTTP